MKIDLHRKGLTGVLDLSTEKDVEEIDCSNNMLSKLILPPGIKKLVCRDNQLIHLDLPSSMEYIDCSDNQLTQLILPSGVNEFHCSNNKLSELIIPPTTAYISCERNQLTKFILPAGFNGVVSLNDWPLEDRNTRISILDSSYAFLVENYYESQPELVNGDKLTLRNQITLRQIQRRWIDQYRRPGGIKSHKLMQESMKLLCE